MSGNQISHFDHILSQCEFRAPIPSDIPDLRRRFRNKCEYISELGGHEEIENLKAGNYNELIARDLGPRVLLYQGNIIGIVFIENSLPQQDVYYISYRCTSDIPHDPIFNSNFVSPGRLLWCYILGHINQHNITHNNRHGFMIYNHTTPEAYGYHIKMGMYPSTFIKQNTGLDMKALFKMYPNLNEADLPEASWGKLGASPRPLLDEFDNTYLFYVYDKSIDYSNVKAIMKSLPNAPVENMFSNVFNDRFHYGGQVNSRTTIIRRKRRKTNNILNKKSKIKRKMSKKKTQKKRNTKRGKQLKKKTMKKRNSNATLRN